MTTSKRAKRSHHCNELRSTHAGEIVTLMGWVAQHRNLGGLIFVDLRDIHGKTQIVFDPATSDRLYKQAQNLRAETVIAIKGKTALRPDNMRNPSMGTGDIEIHAISLEIFSKMMNKFEVWEEDKKGESILFI